MKSVRGDHHRKTQWFAGINEQTPQAEMQIFWIEDPKTGAIFDLEKGFP